MDFWKELIFENVTKCKPDRSAGRAKISQTFLHSTASGGGERRDGNWGLGQQVLGSGDMKKKEKPNVFIAKL